VAKAISVGASLVGTAYPILHSAVKGAKAVEETLQIILEELRTSMFLVGAGSIRKLRKAPLVVTGKTAEWLIMRGFEPQIYARRGQ
jgi:isopentenyl-diphosphate delta-isomerase